MAKIITLPGLIDPHVHLRDPGQTHKEDFLTGTQAALAGGFTMVLDMPNNSEPITTLERLERKITSAKAQTVCDIGFNFGTLADNFEEFPKVKGKVTGLKVYLNKTTGNFIIDKSKLLQIYQAWTINKPILVHAEDDVLPEVIEVIKTTKKPTHVCHISSQEELELIISAKKDGLPLTCGVTPHHLFMTDKDREKLGAYATMKPTLKSQADQDFLWKNLQYIDIVESDHAPHTIEEKEAQEAPFGVPGLETTLPLMLQAVEDKRLTLEQVIDRLYTNTKRIFSLPDQPDTAVVVDMSKFVITNKDLKTKAGWSPFDGWTVTGKIQSVKLRGQIVYKKGQILAKPGSGQIITTA